LTRSYNDDISLEDAIHTALLTLKEGFEGQMTEKTIEIGIISGTKRANLAKPSDGEEAEAPTFRKLSEADVRDYLVRPRPHLSSGAAHLPRTGFVTVLHSISSMASALSCTAGVPRHLRKLLASGRAHAGDDHDPASSMTRLPPYR
jgi:hypothetical protein